MLALASRTALSANAATLRPSAARAVARRARIGAGTLGSDPQHAAVVAPDDAAAAGADRDDIEDGRAHRQPVDLGLGRQLRTAVLDEADIGRGAAHVEGDEAL